MSRHPEYQFSASIYINGRLHIVYGYAQQGNVPITRELLSDYYGRVTVRGRLFNGVYIISSLFLDVSSSRLRDLPRDRASSSTLRRAPPSNLSSRYEVPEIEVPVPPDVPIAVENRDRSADMVLVYGPRGNMRVGRPAPLPRPRPLPVGTVTEGGRSGPAATVLEPEAEGMLRAIGHGR